jgi:type I restriction enzyme S subunit
LPPGWIWTDTASVAEVQGGIQKQPKRAPRSNRYPFLRVANVLRGHLDLQQIHEIELFDGDLDKFRLRHGDLLVVEGNGSPHQIGRAALWLGEIENCVHQNHLIRVRPTTAINPKYLAYYWNASKTTEHLRSMASSTSGLYVLTAAKVRGVRVPLPPLKEQERIVAAIEEQLSRVDAGVAALHRVRQSLKRVRAAVLQAAATGKLVPHSLTEDVEMMLERIAVERRDQWKAHTPKTYKEPAAADPFPLKVPDHWRIASLEALTHPVRVICYGILMPKENVSNGIPYVRVKDMKGWTIDVPGLKRTSHEIAAKYARASLKPGDLLLAIRGTYGRVAIVPNELDGANITQDSARIAAHEAIDHRYLLYYLGGSVANRYYQRVARGVAVKGVNIGDLRSMPVPVPPHDEQVTIANEVERQFTVLDQIEATVDAALTRGSSLRSSILAAAFSGQLVPQDPGDEPASILLERIAKERAASSRGKLSTKAARRTEVTA